MAYGYVSELFGVHSDLTSGIYILHPLYYHAVAVLLPVAFGLATFGWFGLHRTQKTKSTLFAIIMHTVISGLFVYSGIQILLFLDFDQFLFRPIILFTGLIVWGYALLKARALLAHPNLAYWAAIILLIVGMISVSIFLPLVLYYGLEYWFALLGWSYTFAALVTTYSFYRLAGKQITPQK